MSPSKGNRTGPDGGGASEKASGPLGKDAIDAALKKQREQQEKRSADPKKTTAGKSTTKPAPSGRHALPDDHSLNTASTGSKAPGTNGVSMGGSKRPPAPKKAAFLASYTQTHPAPATNGKANADTVADGTMVFTPKPVPTTSAGTTTSAATPSGGAHAQAPKAATPKVDAPKAQAPQAATPKVEAPKAETPKAATPKVEAPKAATPQVEVPKAETPKVEAPKVTTPKVATQAPQAATPKVEAPKAAAPKVEAPKVEAPKVTAPKVEAPKTAAPKAETPKGEAPKVEAPKATAPKVEAPQVHEVRTLAGQGHTTSTTTDVAETHHGLPAETHRPAPNKQIKITEKTINRIVGQAIRSVPGVIALDGGMEKVTGRSYPRYDLALDDDGDSVSIDAHIAVGWPAPVAEVAQKVRETIITWVSDMTDVPVSHANVTVGVVDPGHERTTQTQLDAFNPHPVLTPITVAQPEPTTPVVTTSINDSVRSIPVPRPATLVAFSSGQEPVITQPEVAPGVEVVSPQVAPSMELSAITVAPSPEIKPVVVADSQELTPIVVSEPAELRPITVTEPVELRRVEAPEPQELTQVSAPTPQALLQVSQKPSLPKVPVTVAPETPLTPVTTQPIELTEVRAPTPVPVSRVKAPTGHRLADVTPPTPTRLAEITTTRKPLTRVQQPREHRLATVSVPEKRLVSRPKAPQQTRLTRIVTKGMRVQDAPRVDATPLRPTGVPAEKPLRPIVVRSPELKPIKVVTEQ